MHSLLVSPFTILAVCIVLFLIVVPLMLLDDSRRGAKWTRGRKVLAMVSGVLFLLVACFFAVSVAIEQGI